QPKLEGSYRFTETTYQDQASPECRWVPILGGIGRGVQRAGWPQGIAPLGLPRIRTCPLGHTALHIMNSLRGGTLSESAIRLAPDTAIHCCFVGTVKGFDAPAMFPSNGVMTWRPLLSTGSLGWFPRFNDTM